MTRRERDARREARNHEIVAAYRRGVRVPRLAAKHGITRQAVYKIVRNWDDMPSIPHDGVRVDGSEEFTRILVAYEQAIADLAEIASGDAPPHVRLGAITRSLEVYNQRIALLMAAGYMPGNLAEPQIEQRMLVLVRGILDVVRDLDVADEALRRIIVLAESQIHSRPSSRDTRALAA